MIKTWTAVCCAALLMAVSNIAANDGYPSDTGAKNKLPGSSFRHRNKSNFECASRLLEETRIPRLRLKAVSFADAVAYVQKNLPEDSCVAFSLNISLKDVRVTTPALKDITLMQAIRAITEGADADVSFVLHSDGEMAFQTVKRTEPIYYVDRLAIDLPKFREELAGKGIKVDDRFRNESNKKIWLLSKRLEFYFKDKGIELSDRSHATIYADLGQLEIFGTLEETAAIQKVMETFLANRVVPMTQVDAAEGLQTHVFRVDSEALKKQIADAGIVLTTENRGSFNTPRVVGDFPSQERGEDLRIITSAHPSGVFQPSGLNFVTKPNVIRTANDSLRAFLEKRGIPLEPPSSVFFSDSRGDLIVRAPLETLKQIHDVIAPSLKKDSRP